VLAGVALIGLDRPTAEAFAALRARLRSTGQLINDHDLWIAATALRHDLTLLTRDHHFDRIQALKR
jgi:predicted nucleic acid-binding protein